MSITIDDPETEALTTQLAKMTGLSVNDAVALAVGEAIARRRTAESPAKLPSGYGNSTASR
jgi:hypothetical protein